MLKRNGISFVMINLGNLFADNVKKPKPQGMPWGAYYYTRSAPKKTGKELDKILGRLAGKNRHTPLQSTLKDGDGYKSNTAGTAKTSAETLGILDGLKRAGYYPMIYTGFEEVENLLDRDIYMGVDMWFGRNGRRAADILKNNLGMAIWRRSQLYMLPIYRGRDIRPKLPPKGLSRP